MEKKCYLTPAIKMMVAAIEPLLEGSLTQEVPTDEEEQDDVELGAKSLQHYNVWDE